MFGEGNNIPRAKNGGNMTHSDPNISSSALTADDDYATRNSSASVGGASGYDAGRMSCEGSPMTMSPWNQTSNTMFSKSEWSEVDENSGPQNALIGSLVREEGHIYSLAVAGGLLYTGSDSKNIRVWKDLKEYAAFKSSSGLVKAIIISGEKIFTGHQDGKIRVWKVSPKNPSDYKRAGTLPTLKDIFKSSINPSNYVEGRGRKRALWIKHCDAVSCLSLTEDKLLLYSASWDRTLKVWRIADSKCLESLNVHDDAVNSVVTSVDGLVFTGSADGTVKVWKREAKGKATKHTLVETLLEQECAVTALAVTAGGTFVYCGSSDGMVNFWERKEKLTHGGVMKGHKLTVLCLVAVESMVFSSSADKTICVWRREGAVHTCLSVLTGHTGPVKCLTAEEDNESSKNGDKQWLLYSGSLDKSIKVWRVSEMTVGMMKQQFGTYTDSMPSDKSFSSSNRGTK